MEKIIIKKEEAGERIDKFLSKGLFLDVARGEVIRSIKNGKILVDGKKTKPSYALKCGNEIEISNQGTMNKEQQKIPANPKVKFKIIFENENIIVVDKPAGLQVHPSSKNENDTLVNGLLRGFPEIREVGEDPMRPGIVHRLDKDTSGVMIIARSQEAFQELKRKFKDREVEKKYVALVYGHIIPKEGVIEKPIARASTYKKQVIAGKKTKTKVRPAATDYKVIESKGDFDLVEARPKTGRMHQIRVHLFSIGHPIVGDKLYKLKKNMPMPEIGRQLLHAKEIKLELWGKEYDFRSDIPSEFSI